MSSVELYLILSVVIIIGVWMWARKVKREINATEVYIKEEIGKIMFMRIEHHNNLLFAYNAFNEEFICQGSSLEDLNTQFGKRFPNRRGVIVAPEEEPNV
jgi:hypothetical protein